MCYRTLLLSTWALMALPVMAQVAPAVQGSVTAHVPPGTDSEKAHILSLLVKGDINGAIAYWGAANVGRQTPAWLLTLKMSYEASKQTAGKCQEVARNIHAAFTQLGGKPLFVELRNEMSDGRRLSYMVFRTAGGKDLSLSKNAYHVAVKLEGQVYDAYTGPAGLPWKEYISRIGSPTRLVVEFVEEMSQGSP